MKNTTQLTTTKKIDCLSLAIKTCTAGHCATSVDEVLLAANKFAAYALENAEQEEHQPTFTGKRIDSYLDLHALEKEFKSAFGILTNQVRENLSDVNVVLSALNELDKIYDGLTYEDRKDHNQRRIEIAEHVSIRLHDISKFFSVPQPESTPTFTCTSPRQTVHVKTESEK